MVGAGPGEAGATATGRAVGGRDSVGGVATEPFPTSGARESVAAGGGPTSGGDGGRGLLLAGGGGSAVVPWGRLEERGTVVEGAPPGGRWAVGTGAGGTATGRGATGGWPA